MITYPAAQLQLASHLDERDSLPTVHPDSFEKDDDANFHVDFLHALTNLRARNYGLEEYDWMQVKIKAGRIIPALVTTTAVVAGLVCVQLVQLVAGAPVEQLKNSFVNLAVPYIAQSEPGPPPSRVITDTVCNAARPRMRLMPAQVKATIWDRWGVDEGPAVTLRQLLGLLASRYGVRCVGLRQRCTSPCPAGHWTCSRAHCQCTWAPCWHAPRAAPSASACCPPALQRWRARHPRRRLSI